MFKNEWLNCLINAVGASCALHSWHIKFVIGLFVYTILVAGFVSSFSAAINKFFDGK